MTGLLVLVILVVLALSVPRYGLDSRDGRDWNDGRGREVPRAFRGHTPAGDLRALRRVARRFGRAAARAWQAQEQAWGACWQAHQPWRGDDLPPHRGELRWRELDGDWRLDGRTVPGRQPFGPAAR